MLIKEIMISYKSLNQFSEIKHFCTTRKGGYSSENYHSFNLSPYSGDNITDITRNKILLSREIGIQQEKIIIPFQTHESNILNIDAAFFNLPEEEQIQKLHSIDALVTDTADICIGITTADCVPLTFFDPIKKVIGVAHAGWRGTCAKIAEKTIQAMTSTYGSSPQDIYTVIGPSISVEAYNIGIEVVDLFNEAGFDMNEIVIEKKCNTYLDLWNANRQVLEKAGVSPEKIEIAGICTSKNHEHFFSARKLGIKSGRMLSGIMLI